MQPSRRVGDAYLIAQAANRYYFHSIFTGVRHFTTGKDYQQIRFLQSDLLFGFVFLCDETFDFKKMFRAFFYFVATELAFYQAYLPSSDCSTASLSKAQAPRLMIIRHIDPTLNCVLDTGTRIITLGKTPSTRTQISQKLLRSSSRLCGGRA